MSKTKSAIIGTLMDHELLDTFAHSVLMEESVVEGFDILYDKGGFHSAWRVKIEISTGIVPAMHIDDSSRLEHARLMTAHWAGVVKRLSK